MKYFIDFEFLEDGKTIDPISLGIVADDGRELYVQFTQSDDFDARLTPWLRANVLPHLTAEPWLTRDEARQAILNFVGGDKTIQFWGYYADYDWVALCQLFGRMIDLPKGWPKYCRDIKQLCDDLGNPRLPEQGKGEHHALADARWNKQAWEFLRAQPIEFYSACEPSHKPGGWQAGETSWMFTFPLADGRTVRMHAGEAGRQSLRKIVLWEEIDHAADVAMERL